MSIRIYTKTGDSGQTSLLGGQRVPKHHLRIEAYGNTDELNAHIGLLRDLQQGNDTALALIRIQNQLFVIGSHLAMAPGKVSFKLPELNPQEIRFLEEAIDTMNERLPEMKNFVLPGGHPVVSQCHITRCVCRRAERGIVHLSEIEPVDPFILEYMNRLSDYFFVLGRYYCAHYEAIETPWLP